jgi:hypothetical protein
MIGKTVDHEWRSMQKLAMPVIAFDTLKFLKRLKAALAPEGHAKALETQISTRAAIARVERELLVLKWAMGATFGSVLALILKTFF